MKALRPLVIFLFFFSVSAHANHITLESQWCCAGIPGILTFTYDDTALDTFLDADLDGPLAPDDVQIGVYSNAILSASYLVTSGADIGKVYSFVPGSTSTISIVRKYNANGTTTSIFMNLYDGANPLDVFLGIEGIPPSTDSLSELPGSKIADLATLQLGFKILSQSGYGELVFKEVATAPAPAAAWLFGPALLGLIGVSRSRK